MKFYFFPPKELIGLLNFIFENKCFLLKYLKNNDFRMAFDSKCGCYKFTFNFHHAFYIGLKARASRGPYTGRLTVSQVHVHVHTRTHCTVADYFCQGMQLKNFGHFYRAPVSKIPVALQIFGTRIFSAFAD